LNNVAASVSEWLVSSLELTLAATVQDAGALFVAPID